MGVARLAHDTTEDEFSGDVGVDDTNDESWHNDECERGLLVDSGTERAESWGSGVLSEVVESDGGWNDEKNGGDTGEDSERLGEVLRTFHLGDESWEENLWNPQESDVEDSVEAVDPSGAWLWESVGRHFTIGWVVAIVAVERSSLNTCKDEEENDSDTHACGGEHGHEGDVLEGSRNGHDDTHKHDNDGENDSAERVVG